jgi:hypothetical protein
MVSRLEVVSLPSPEADAVRGEMCSPTASSLTVAEPEP